jgi:hypothetical protein
MSIKNLNPTNSKHLSGDFAKYHPKKYYGEVPIWYRSSYEFKFMIICERNPNVIKWSSEEIKIPYTITERVNGKKIIKHKIYNTDFTVHLKNGKVIVIEVKPFSQSPQFKEQIQRSPIMYKNARKWKAALEWCKKRNYEFKVITEVHLGTRIF